MTFNKLRRGDAREALLAATVQVVATGGVDAVTHRRVATEAGVSPGSATHHFASRDDLLREAFRFYLRQGDVLLGELADAARSATDPMDRVERLLSGLIEFELQEVVLLRAEYELLLFASGDAELSADVRAWESRWVAHLADWLEAAGTRRPIETARTLLNLVRGFELECLLDDQLDLAAFQRRVGLVLAPLSASLSESDTTS